MFSDKISKIIVVEEDKYDEEDWMTLNSKELQTLSYVVLETSTFMALYMAAASQSTCWSAIHIALSY
jgi:hypothetical protein